jgi:hypothetical protein
LKDPGRGLAFSNACFFTPSLSACFS